ncbi:hypothetical protein PRIC2_005450 [Phytophthora ramorum]
MTRPNILVTGTPGTGKTSMCQQLAERSQLLSHLNVGDLVKERGLHSGRDEEFDCFVLDEDKVCDEMEDMMAEGGKVVDFHTCDFFPERWFDLVVVLRADNTTLFDRLQKRGYSDKKVAENVECEIMEVVLQEARESYCTRDCTGAAEPHSRGHGEQHRARADVDAALDGAARGRLNG